MKLKDLKEWVNSLPENFMEFDVVNAEEGTLDDANRMQELAGLNEEEQHDYTYRLDRPIMAFAIDEKTEEVLLVSNPKS